MAQQAAQYTDLQRSITISSYEDSERVLTTQRTLINNNACYAVNYFVRKVLDVYGSTTKVTSVTIQVTAGNYVSAVLTPAEVDQVEAQYRSAVEALLAGLPTVGEVVEQPTTLSVSKSYLLFALHRRQPAHCCALDPDWLDQATLIRLECEQAEAQKIGYKCS